MEFYLLYLQCDPYFMQVILRKPSHLFTGHAAGTPAIFNETFHLNDSWFSSIVTQVNFSQNHLWHLILSELIALMNTCQRNNFIQHTPLIRFINQKPNL